MSKKQSLKKKAPINNNRPTKTGGNNKKVKKSPVIRASKQELAIRIPECVHHFMHALVDPFSAPSGACLPCDLFPLPSGKYKTFARGRMALGTAGVGFVYMTPTAARNISFMGYSSAATVCSVSSPITSATNQGSLFNLQSPFTDAQLTGFSVASRIVAAGIRLKYVGQLAQRNGVVTAFEDPDHQDARRFTYDEINSSPYSDIVRVGMEEWDGTVCLSGPVAPQEVEFLNSQYNMGASVAPMILVVSGVAGDVYEIEGYIHFEVIGTIVVDKTKSHAEPSFFGKVIEAAKNITEQGPMMPSKAPSLWDRFVDTVREGLPSMVTTIGNAIAPGAGSIAGLITRGLQGPPPDSVFNRLNYGTIGHRPPQLIMN
jgi:hypothetical protein